MAELKLGNIKPVGADNIVVDGRYVKGGYVSVTTKDELFADPTIDNTPNIKGKSGENIVKGSLCYCAEDDSFYQYDGQTWQLKEFGAELVAHLKEYSLADQPIVMWNRPLTAFEAAPMYLFEGNFHVATDIKSIGNIELDGHINNIFKKGNGGNAVILNDLANNLAAGQMSVAIGTQTRALMPYSFAAGMGTTANGAASVAEGISTSTGGNGAHAEGQGTVAAKWAAHAEGYLSQATESIAHAEGRETLASAIYAHAEGLKSQATGQASHAEGEQTKAQGMASHAEGYETEVLPDINSGHAEGRYTIVSGIAGHAEGLKSQAQGEASHAEGRETIATGKCSHAEGFSVEAVGDRSHAEGDIEKLSISHVQYTDFKDPCLASMDVEKVRIAVLDDDKEAYEYSCIAKGNIAHREGRNTTAYGWVSHAEGEGTLAVGERSHTEGYLTATRGENAHAEGYASYAYGNAGHSEGHCTFAANGAHAEGSNVSEIGRRDRTDIIDPEGLAKETVISTEEDYILEIPSDRGIIATHINTDPESGLTTIAVKGPQALDIGSHAEGIQTIAYGRGAHSEGYRSAAFGNYAHAEGWQTRAEGAGSHTSGIGTIATEDYQTVVGAYNANESTAKFIVGIGTSEQKSNCFSTGKALDGNSYIKVGNITLTEAQLEKIISFINAIE